MYIVQYASYNVHCTICIIQCTLYNMHHTMYIVQYASYNVHCTICIMHHTICIIQCTLYNSALQ